MKSLVSCMVVAFIVLALLPSPAPADVRSDVAAGAALGEVIEGALGENSTDQEIESVVMQMVQGGAFAGDAVAAALAAGYDPVPVIRGAFLGGGPLMSIISAAVVNSGMTVDEAGSICLKCGADAEDVATAVAMTVEQLNGDGYAGEAKDGDTEKAGAEDEDDYGYGAGGGYGLPPLLHIPSGGAGGGGSNISPNS